MIIKCCLRASSVEKAGVLLSSARPIVEGVREDFKSEPDKENNVFGVTPMRSETPHRRSVHERLGSMSNKASGHKTHGSACNTLEDR